MKYASDTTCELYIRRTGHLCMLQHTSKPQQVALSSGSHWLIVFSQPDVCQGHAAQQTRPSSCGSNSLGAPVGDLLFQLLQLTLHCCQ